MTRRAARVNQAGLLAVGLLLLAAGAAALARGLDLRPDLLGPAHAPLISSYLRQYPRNHRWFWPAGAGVAVLVALLALRWLSIQGATGAIRRLPLETDDRGGTTHLPARAATAALEQDLAASPDLPRVRAILTGTPRAPRLILTVTLSASADPAAARHRIDQAIGRLRQTLDTENLPAVLHLRITAARI